MPKETFLNLPAEKRDRFVEAALDEFCARPYDQASITAIVARLGIAKGSVYQYFDDKVDLFSWLCDEAARRKLAAIEAGAAPSGAAPSGFFARLRAMYRTGLLAWQREPRWALVSLRLVEPSVEPRIEAKRREARARAFAWMRAELTAARAAGELAPHVDPDIVTPLVLAVLQDGLLASLLARAGAELGDPEAPARLAAVPIADLEVIADAAVGMLERGVGAGR